MFALRHPTISKAQLEGSGLQKFYILHPEDEMIDSCFYESDDDFMNDLEIHFDKRQGKELSASGARLPELLRVPLVEDLFREKGYALEFQPNEYLMSPDLFQNVYLGALGEEVASIWSRSTINGISCSPLGQGEYEIVRCQRYPIRSMWTLNFGHPIPPWMHRRKKRRSSGR